MFKNAGWCMRLISSAALILALSLSAARAQDPALEDIKYSEDYERIQALVKVPDLQKRADRALLMYKDRPDMSDKLRPYLDAMFARDLEALMKQQNFALLKNICEKAIKIRPKFGDVYLYYGVALKNLKMNKEAMSAFARGYVITNKFQKQAKQQLDILYRAENGGSLVGEEKLVSQAAKELR